jgi:hypothetical protein
MIDDAIGEAAADAAGAVVRHAGGFIVDLAFAYVFSGYTARFFHGVGRRSIAIATWGHIRIPSSLRTAPKGVRSRPRRSDRLALWIGVAIWLGLFLALCATGWKLL